jgi:hypothetical protein
MKLQRREKLLLATTAGLFVLGLVWFLFVAGDSGSMEKLAKDQERLTVENTKKATDLADAQRAAKQLADWNSRSVPPDPHLYEDWLSKLANQFIPTGLKIESSPKPTGGGKVFTTFQFTLKGHATLDNLTKFLYEFYSAGHLHQIRKMDMKPLPNSKDLDVTITIEAVSLPGGNRKELSKEKGKGLQAAKTRDEYVQLITQRNLFAPFQPRGPQRSVDPAQYAFVTGIVEIDGARQVWLQDRLAGKQWKLNEGQDFQIGEANGKVLKFDSSHAVIVDFGGRHRRLREGNNLRGGVEVRQ